MLKRIVSVLTACLLLALPALCLAQEAGYETYTDAAGRFTFLYPEGWTALSKDTIDGIMDVAASLGNEELENLIESVKPQLEAVDMIMLMSPDMSSNVNVVCQDVGMEMTADMLLAVSGTFQSQLSAQLEGLTFPEDPSLIDVGEDQALMIPYAYTLAGQDFIGVQAYRPNGSDLYIYTLTATAAMAETYSEVLGVVIGSTEFQ